MQQALEVGRVRSLVEHSWSLLAAPASLSRPLASAFRLEARSSQTRQVKWEYQEPLQREMDGVLFN